MFFAGTQKTKDPPNRQVFVFVWKNQALALFARFAMRLILRAAVFLWTTPLLCALAMVETATFTTASLSAAFAAMAAFAFLTTVFRLDLIALL